MMNNTYVKSVSSLQYFKKTILLAMNSNNKEAIMCSFDSSLPSLLSFSTLSSNLINEEYVTQVRQIISTWKNDENNSSTTRQVINNPSIRPQYPQFESVRTPLQQSSSFLPSEFLDCCDS
jgi:hypothetical protein